jgi:hypothetical protein
MARVRFRFAHAKRKRIGEDKASAKRKSYLRRDIVAGTVRQAQLEAGFVCGKILV